MDFIYNFSSSNIFIRCHSKKRRIKEKKEEISLINNFLSTYFCSKTSTTTFINDKYRGESEGEVQT